MVDDLLALYESGETDPRFWSCTIGQQQVLFRVHGLEVGLAQPLQRLFESAAYTNALRIAYPELPQLSACALVYKAPGIGVEVPWHRDPVRTSPTTIFNISVFISAENPAAGCLEAIRGSHLLTTPRSTSIEDMGEPVAIHAGRGDIVIHDTQLVHGSGPNPAPTPRISLVSEWCPNHLYRLRAAGELDGPYEPIPVSGEP